MATTQPNLFAHEERQPAPLSPVVIKPTGWAYEDRIAHIQAHCPTQLTMVGPVVEALAKQRMRELDAREAERRAGNDQTRY